MKFGTPISVVNSKETGDAPKNKFNVSKREDRTIDGVVFDSRLEMNCYLYLKEQGIPCELQPSFELQPKFELNGVKYRPISYVADFRITIAGHTYIVDAKGMRTPDFKMKLKLMACIHKVQIVEAGSVKKLRLFVEAARKGFVVPEKVIAPPTT